MSLSRVSLLMFALVLFAGCTQKQTPQQIREDTARATADLKQNAKAVAEGVREGWSRDKPLNLNTASAEQLESLPGVHEEDAQRIIAGRPYQDPKELVDRRILTTAEYARLSDRVVAR